jgi:hypothetical protein
MSSFSIVKVSSSFAAFSANILRPVVICCASSFVMMPVLWGGRFDGKNEAWIDAFGASIPFDQQLATQDITLPLFYPRFCL